MKRIIDDDLIVSCPAGEADNGELEELAKEMAGSDEVTQDFLAIKNVRDAAVSANHLQYRCERVVEENPQRNPGMR